MTRSTGVVAITLAIAAAGGGTASAGVFGGFAESGTHYLRGVDRVCEPVTGARAAARCEKATARAIAAMHFRKGAVQRGASARIAVAVDGTDIVVRVADGSGSPTRWSAGLDVPIVTAVYFTERHGLVAIEYQVRSAGRRLDDVIVVRIATAPAPPTSAGRPEPEAEAKPKPAPRPDAGTASPAVSRAIDGAVAQARKRRHRKAIEQLRGVLAETPDSVEARYHLAVSLVATGQAAEAIAELVAIRDSSNPEGPRWMVEARFARAFARLRADRQFRAAVGLDAGPGRTRTPYERVVGLGGHWEQPAIPCTDPRVNLRLARPGDRPDSAGKFELTIQSRCGGGTDTTRLSGVWRTEGTSELHLEFPNVDGPEELMSCRLEVCRDASGEDCLRCQPEPDLEILLRVVRR